VTVSAPQTGVGAPPRGVVAAGFASGLASDLVNAATGALSQAQVIFGAFLQTAAIQVAADPGGRFVYAAAGTALYAYTIDAGDGALTPIPGSSYSLPSDSTAMAVEASGRFLYIGWGSPSVLGYSIDPATGELTAIPGSPFAVSSGAYALVGDSAGKYLYATGNGVSVLAINATTGALAEIAGSPFGNFGGDGLAMDPQKRFLFVSGLGGIAGYAINGTTGGLTALTGSPFFPGGPTWGLSFDGTGRFLYVTQGTGNPGSLWGLAVDAVSGNLTLVPGDPFVCQYGCYGVAGDASGQYLYAGFAFFGVQAYQIDGVTGALTSINSVRPSAASIALVPAAGSPSATLQSLQIRP
jgi:6-phosphogluconolactonase